MTVRLALPMLACLAAFPIAAWPDTVSITNARIVTLEDAGVIEAGTLVIEDGRIAAVGADVAIPRGARVYDAAGRTVTPGLFDPFSHLGLVEVLAFADANDAGGSGAAGFDVSPGINGYTTPVPVARAAGITRAAAWPANGQSIFSGQGALVVLEQRPDIVHAPRAFSVVALGNHGAKAAGGSRGAAWFQLRDALDAAATPESGGRLAPADRDALRLAVTGVAPLVVHVERAADILNALELKSEHPDLRLVLSGASEGWLVAEEIAKADVSVILYPRANLPRNFETVAASLENAARLRATGVPVAYSAEGTPTAAGARKLRHAAGVAVANGVAWQDGLRGISEIPARIYGVDDQLGTLAPGKRADLVVWSGDPLEFSSRAERVFIDGVEMPLETRPAALLERYGDTPGTTERE